MNEIDSVQAELEAMKVIVDTLRPLPPESIKKVLRFVNDTYPSRGTAQVTPEEGQENQPMFQEFHELYDATSPRTGPERALIAAYWLQVSQGNEEWDSFLINKELKNFGIPSSNITRDIDVLVRRIPRWVHQTRKEGTSQQARKTYTLTTEGKRAVERMLANNRTSVESNSNS
jgi:hypothetical protein